jgi:hypothetical protein
MARPPLIAFVLGKPVRPDTIGHLQKLLRDLAAS